MQTVMLFTGAILPIFWGIAHLFPKRAIVRGFGDVSIDNRRIIYMEWIIEGITLIFIGMLVLLTTLLDKESVASAIIYWASIVMLNALTVISFFTGFKIRFLPFKLCPAIFTTSSLFILISAVKIG